MRPTISWLSSPSTISTTFITRSSVTRMPCRNSLLMPILVRRSPICGPPPWTITGFMPTSFSITTSRAKPAFSAGSVIALPPYLMMMVLSWNRRMYGSASARICALSAVLTTSTDMEKAGESGQRSAIARIVLRTGMPARAAVNAVSERLPRTAVRAGAAAAFLVSWTAWRARFRIPVPLHLVRRALVTKLRHHGDVLLASPVFTALKRAAPAIEIDALVYLDTAPMLTGHPAIAQLHTIDRGWKKRGVATQLREEWALLSRAARARLRPPRSSDRASARADARAPAAAALVGDARARAARAAVAAPASRISTGCRRAPSGTWSSRTSTRCGASACSRTQADRALVLVPGADAEREGRRAARRARPRAARIRADAPGIALALQVLAGGAHRGARSTSSSSDGLAVVLTGRARRSRARADDGGAGRAAAGDRARASIDLTGALSLTELAALTKAARGVRRRRFGADAHRGGGRHAGARALRPVERARVGALARGAARRGIARVSVPAVRPRRLRRRQGLRVPDHAAGRARARRVRRAARANPRERA